jgi:2-succinyl-5-enolpyruvyl-6-hydroxy-3-cyclohexene-1-carboxylate synthase
MNTADVQAAFCAVLCDEWARAGVTDAVVAPGSRSTPMVLALDADPRIRVTVVLDERAAGFTALGLGLATGRPAVVVTTSGTASVELHPSVVEAAQGYVPLLAVTTDRPPELHHVGAPQTVEQGGLFGSAPRWSVDPGVADQAAVSGWRSLASRCVAEASTGPAGPGPVHLNLPFREPLLGRPDVVEVPPGRPGGAPWHDAGRGRRTEPDPVLVEMLGRHAGGNGLIIAGHGADHPGGAGPVLALAERLGWPLLADPRSGCRVASERVVAAADALLRTAGFAARTPDAVLRVGAPWASKVLNQWLAALPPGVPQALVDPWGRWADPDRGATHLGAVSVADLVVALGPGGSNATSDWAATWRAGEAAASAAMERLLGAGGALELSEPAVARAALLSRPDDGLLLVSSSMPVRDLEWYGPPRAGARVLSNRGANGIDGVVSTALGAALGRPDRPTVAVLGDLAFLYDAGALLWATHRPARLRLLVVDNAGGGIFSFLPQAAALPPAQFERYWGTPHGVDLVALSQAYGVAAARITSRAGLDRFLDPHRAGAPVEVGVVPSDRAGNVTVHDAIHSAVARAVETR